MTTRVESDVFSMIEEAAAFAGLPVNSFIVNAAAEKAGNVLETQRTIRMTARDATLFVQRIENPPTPNEALLEAGRLYREMIRG